MKNKNFFSFLAINKISKVIIILICCAFFSQLSNAANNNLIMAGSMPANPNPNDTVYPLKLILKAYEYANTFNISCFGFKDGSIDLSVSGGTPPYKYQWSEGDTIEDIMNLPAGYYKVTVIDADSNNSWAEITLTQPTPLNNLKAEVTLSKYPNNYNVSCINCYNGSITVDIFGGSGEYIYAWRDDSTATLHRTGLGAGMYFITISDTNACSNGTAIQQNVQLKEPPYNGWSMEGNANISANQFIGTTDERDLIFKANNQERLKLGAGSNTTPGKITITGDGETSRDFGIGRNLLIGGSFRMDSLAGVGFKLDSLSNKSYKLIFADEEGNVVCKKPIPNISPSPCSYDQIGPIPWLTNGNVIGDNESSILGTCNYKPIYFRTNGEHRMIITETGNIGIGTTNPSTNFHVVGNSALMGNVGIGTTAPQAKLEVNGNSLFGTGISNVSIGSCYGQDIGWGTSYLGFNAFKNTSGNWVTQADGSNNGGSVIYGNVGGSLVFSTLPSTGGSIRTNLTDADVLANANMVIYQDGRVGIGTASTENGIGYIGDHFKLAVNGWIGARRLIITESQFDWYDCIFEKDYNLLSLYEVENFIKLNKHLPDIPSETEIKQEGQDLGQMNALLLKKIEELYLYTIAQQKQLDELKKELETLKN